MTKLTKWHPPSLIRVFAVRIRKAWALSFSLSAQRRLSSDWVDAQADQSIRWAHMSLCWFCHEAAHIVYQRPGSIVILSHFVATSGCARHSDLLKQFSSWQIIHTQQWLIESEENSDHINHLRLFPYWPMYFITVSYYVLRCKSEFRNILFICVHLCVCLACWVVCWLVGCMKGWLPIHL